jgi:hypothetical protein
MPPGKKLGENQDRRRRTAPRPSPIVIGGGLPIEKKCCTREDPGLPGVSASSIAQVVPGCTRGPSSSWIHGPLRSPHRARSWAKTTTIWRCLWEGRQERCQCGQEAPPRSYEPPGPNARPGSECRTHCGVGGWGRLGGSFFRAEVGRDVGFPHANRVRRVRRGVLVQSRSGRLRGGAQGESRWQRKVRRARTEIIP